MARIKPIPEPKPVFPQFKFEKADTKEAGWWNRIRTSLHDALRGLSERWRHQEIPEVFYQRSGTTVVTNSNPIPDTKPVFPQFVLVKPEPKTTHWWDWDSVRHSFHDAIRKINDQWYHEDVEEVHDQAWSLPSNIPRCHLNCIFEQALHRGCSYSDFFCICYQIDQDMLAFESCTKDCRDNQIERFAPGAILDFCGSQNIALDLPGFMKPYQHLNRRQSFSQPVSFSLASQTTYTVTTTTPLPYGDDPYTYYTSGEVNALTITEVVGVPDTEILHTDSVTTTLPSGARPFTSTFTNADTPDITILVGIPALGPTPTNGQGKPTGGSILTPSSRRHGLSNGAKIGIGVAVPLVALLLLGFCLLFFLRRRKRAAVPGAPGGPQQQELDGKNIAAVSEMPNNPSYIGHASPPSPANDWNAPKDGPYIIPTATHELNAREDAYHPDASEIGGSPRHEIEGSVDTRYELTSNPSLASSSVMRKPVSPAPAYATHAAPAPWEDHGYDPYQNSASAPVLTEQELEIQRMEEEMAQVRLRKERLQNLQMLEEREEELKRSIAEKRTKG